MNRFAIKLGLMFVLFTAYAAVAANPVVSRFGDLSYERERWIVSDRDGDFVVRGASGEQDWLFASISSKPASEGKCRASDIAEKKAVYHGGTRKGVIAKDGFEIHFGEYDLGCRNWRPFSVEACTTHKDKTYRFASHVGGCQGGAPTGDGFVEFLNSLKAVD